MEGVGRTTGERKEYREIESERKKKRDVWLQCVSDSETSACRLVAQRCLHQLLYSCFPIKVAQCNRCEVCVAAGTRNPAVGPSMTDPAYILQDEADCSLEVSPVKPSIADPAASGKAPEASTDGQSPSKAGAAGENAVDAVTSILIQCKICLEMLAKHCFGKGKNSQCVCLECRRADEAAEKQVKGTAEEAQWKQLKATGGADYRKVIIDFRKKCPAKGRGAPRAKFDFATTFKTIESFNQVQSKAHCRYMTETHFLEWSQTAEGGSYTPMQAKDRWDEMFADKTVGRDTNGKGGADRLLIHMFDDVVGSSGTRSSKTKALHFLVSR